MVPDEPTRTGLLLVALGLATLGAGLAVGGMPADTVFQYTAAEISGEDGELHAEPVPPERSGNLHQLPVDGRIVCLPSVTRECYLELNALEEGETPGYPLRSAHDYLYADGQFYELTHDRDDQTMGHEPVATEEALSRLAVPESELDGATRAAIDDGTVRTVRELPAADILVVTDDGDYYTVYRSGSKQYGDTGSFCSSAGDGFCDRADRTRYRPVTMLIFGAVFGMVGIVTGGRRILEGLRE
ncbi:hypothetical protein AArcSl_1238 [Halalkaliarchaeum desulfuricum]|uniref:Uncharacterized protein n=1 Tax=Halalkaliarchaeum desulfuricum TaxID=2055893 RepID=A0A343TIE8_9EURY|nr:hypothetical protein [Halalkaliarchaeum desulfuricum]AUX08870.1 hypothetical protein AArcSl_1238 [Halalkaliarchaeum desulfuricum]